MNKNIKEWTNEYITNLKQALDAIDIDELEKAINILKSVHSNYKRIYIIGNGGSASTATHIASDLCKTVKGHKGDSIWPGFKAMSLSDNISCLTAWGNDTGYDNIYAGQIENLCEKGDVLIAMSSSGNSQNIINGVNSAQKIGANVITITGFGGGKLSKLGDVNLITHANHYGPVEDIQLILNHIFTFYFYDLFDHETKNAK
jgi:D-sedoheptulose 7-phosphate isomerase